MAFLLFVAVSLRAAGTFDIYVIDVEHGNAVLAVSPTGESMLMDAGPPGPKYLERILAAIHDAGVNQIDYAVISHYHWDHYGTIPELAARLPIRHYVDHGRNVEKDRTEEFYRRLGGGNKNPLYDAYVIAREQGQHIVVKPGDHIPFGGTEVTVVSSAGEVLSAALPGAASANPACWLSGDITEDELEDAQSVGLLMRFGQFRFVNLGDLTWNISRRLFCPENKVGTADLYLVTHHGLSKFKESASPEQWSTSSCPPGEVYGLRPRVAILTAGEDYVGRLGTPEAWQRVRFSPGLEDIWETHYQAQGGPANNPPPEFIATYRETDPGSGGYIKASAQADGSFTVRNQRNGFTKHYPPGRPGEIVAKPAPSAALPATPTAPPVTAANSTGTPKWVPVHTLAAHERYVSAVAFSPDGKWLATGSWDGTARLWDIATGKMERVYAHHQMAVRTVAFSPDGQWLALGSDDTTVTLWQTSASALSRKLDSTGGYVVSVNFSPDGHWLAAATTCGKINLWDLTQDHKLTAWAAHDQSVNSVVFSPDSQQLVSGSRDASIKFWTLPDTRLLRTLRVGPEHFYVHSLAFRADGRTLVSGSTGGTIKLWDAATGDCLVTTPNGNRQPYIEPIAMAPDGRWFAAGNGAGQVQFWDAATGKKLGTLTAHPGGVEAVALSRDGRWLATGGDDNRAVLWRLEK